MQKGLILLSLSVLVLLGTVAAVYKSFVRPVEIPPAVREPVSPAVPEEETFRPPTVVETEVQVDEETGEETTVEVEIPASHKEGFYNILLLGTDDDGTRTDTIMIGRLDTADHTVALMSIPRDTLISGNYNVPKINSVYGGAGKGVAGIEALKAKLAQTLGFEVDGYVMVNLEAFVELVDLVGGVDFDVPQDMYYSDPSQDLYIDLKAGPQHLDGWQAMGLVRFRKGYATQDIMRTQVQQQFLQVLMKQCLSLYNLPKIGEMAQIFADHVTTDLTLGNIAYFGQELLRCDPDTMFTYTLEGEAVMVNDASCYALYRNKTLEVVNQYFNPYEAEITAANVSIRTPEEVYAQQAAQREQEEAQKQEEQNQLPQEEIPYEDLPEELRPPEAFQPSEEMPQPELPTDQWVTEDPLPEPDQAA